MCKSTGSEKRLADRVKVIVLGLAVSSRSGIIIINNNSYGNVYGAVIMIKVIARVHPVHLMNVD